ncbi:Neuropeptide S receptor [Branchiostoma belcheri]|nr:Neuropeptide S receptor [Branchiostoma belcheri]
MRVRAQTVIPVFGKKCTRSPDSILTEKKSATISEKSLAVWSHPPQDVTEPTAYKDLRQAFPRHRSRILYDICTTVSRTSSVRDRTAYVPGPYSPSRETSRSQSVAMANDSLEDKQTVSDFLPTQNQTANVSTQAGGSLKGTIYSLWQTSSAASEEGVCPRDNTCRGLCAPIAHTGGAASLALYTAHSSGFLPGFVSKATPPECGSMKEDGYNVKMKLPVTEQLVTLWVLFVFIVVANSLTEQLVTLWVLFVFIVVGNSLVLLIMWLERNKRSRMNFFILNLAIADLSAGLFNVLPEIVHRFVVEWIAGNTLCKIVKYTQAVLLYASTYVLVAMSIDRYDAIVHPLQFIREHKSKVMIGMAWGLACVFSVPSPVIFAVRLQPNGERQCWAEWPEDWYWVPYMTVVAAIVFFIPLGIISYGYSPPPSCTVALYITNKFYETKRPPLVVTYITLSYLDSICYIAIIVKIWKRGKGMAYDGHIPRSRAPSEQQDTIWLQTHNLAVRDPLKRTKWSPDTQRRCSSNGFTTRAKARTIKLSVAIILAFICCWSPYFLFDILDNYNVLPDTAAKEEASLIIQNLPALNSAINPIIYGFCSTKLYRKLRKIAVINWIAVHIFRLPEAHREGPKSTKRPDSLGAHLDRTTALTDASTDVSSCRKISKNSDVVVGSPTAFLCPRNAGARSSHVTGNAGARSSHVRSARLLQADDAAVTSSHRRPAPPIALCVITEQAAGSVRRKSSQEVGTPTKGFDAVTPQALLRRCLSAAEITSAV